MLGDTIDDLNQIAEFLVHLYKLKPRDDDKLRKLRELLQKDPDLKGRKVLIFTEFADTARHIGTQLAEAGVKDLFVIDGGTSPDNRVGVIRRFAPYYNGSSSADLATRSEIRTLISPMSSAKASTSGRHTTHQLRPPLEPSLMQHRPRRPPHAPAFEKRLIK